MGKHDSFGPLEQDTNVARKFSQTAREFPSLPAIISEAAVINHAQLLAASIAFAKRFQLLGVNRESTIAINTGDMPTAIATLMATSFLGCRLVTASEVVRKQGIIQPTHFVRSPDAKGKRGVDFAVVDRMWFEAASEVQPSDAEDFPGPASPDDIWLILHTSGTTGKPKFLGLTHRMVMDRTTAIAEDFPTAQVTCAMLFNCTSRPFFARAIGALLNACAIVDSNNSAFWKRTGVNTVFCSPNQFETFAKEYGISEKFKKVEISGAKLEDKVARTLSGHFDQIIDIYGASETNKTFANVVTVAEDGSIIRKGQKLDSTVEIIGPDGAPCPPGKSGAVRVRNGYMIDGYIGAPEATAKNFIEGWFHPGDVAMWGPNGELDVIGRNDEVISFGGVKIDAQLIDLIIKSVPGVKDAVSFKSPKREQNEVLAFVVFEDDANRINVHTQIREDYQKHTGLPCFLGPIHEIDEVPYTDNGRPMRDFCQQLVLQKSESIRALDDK